MAQIETIPGANYTTLASWFAVEGAADYGAGNPITAEITGRITGAFISATPVPPNGAIIRAAAGQEYNYRNHATAAGITGTTELRIRAQGFTISGIVVDVASTGTYGAVNLGEWEATTSIVDGCYVRNTANAGINIAGNGAYARTEQIRNCVLHGCYGSGVNINSAGGSAVVDNCLLLGNYTAASIYGGGLRVSADVTVTNTLGLGNYYKDFYQGAVGNYNASSDTTAPGVNSLHSRTTADLVDFAGGDYRTASGSALATAGSGGTFIGYELEAGGGLTISLTGIDSTNLFDITEVLVPPVISFTPIDSTNLFDITQVVHPEIIQLSAIDSANDLPGPTLTMPQIITLNAIDSLNLFSIAGITGGLVIRESSIIAGSLRSGSLFPTRRALIQ